MTVYRFLYWQYIFLTVIKLTKKQWCESIFNILSKISLPSEFTDFSLVTYAATNLVGLNPASFFVSLRCVLQYRRKDLSYLLHHNLHYNIYFSTTKGSHKIEIIMVWSFWSSTPHFLSPQYPVKTDRKSFKIDLHRSPQEVCWLSSSDRSSMAEIVAYNALRVTMNFWSEDTDQLLPGLRLLLFIIIFFLHFWDTNSLSCRM